MAYGAGAGVENGRAVADDPDDAMPRLRDGHAELIARRGIPVSQRNFAVPRPDDGAAVELPSTKSRPCLVRPKTRKVRRRPSGSSTDAPSPRASSRALVDVTMFFTATA